MDRGVRPPLKERCIAIPAIRNNAAIPDQLMKKLAGMPLIARVLNTARACLPGSDIYTLTDSEEISLLCERADTECCINPELRFESQDIFKEMRDFLCRLAQNYRHCIILRPYSPLLTWIDLENAWKAYKCQDADILVTVRKVSQRLWKALDNDLSSLLMPEEQDKKTCVVESRALMVINLDLVRKNREPGKIVPWFLGENGIEIENYQDWWICERLLNRRHIVFVVAGYPAIGMGHVYRALMLAHEISEHKVSFVCTRESELAVENVASRDYEVIRQGPETLEQTVLSRRPDLVVNDFLDTPVPYMQALAAAGVRSINFEDMGPGSRLAALTINALDNGKQDSDRVLRGPAWFCLRDEFALAPRNEFRQKVKVLLITFGGTDQRNFTCQTLEAVEPVCREENIAIRIVAGPGYAHKEELSSIIEKLANPSISFTWATNTMSRMMEGADIAICSAGRTVYELAHMRVPAIVFATHRREAAHKFARFSNGFIYGGLMENCSGRHITTLFQAMLPAEHRYRCWLRQNHLSFNGNKEKVVALMLEELNRSSRPEKPQTDIHLPHSA